MGNYSGRLSTKYRLGSRLGADAAAAGANFINPEIARLVRREAAYREPGALIPEQRLWTNLLSSMSLCFNVLGILKLDLSLATRVISVLCPQISGIQVEGVLFEHAPARGSPALTGDHTAWDAFIIYSRPSGSRGFIAVECKYTEDLPGSPLTLPPPFSEIASQTGLFRTKLVSQSPPVPQFAREHLMAQAYLSTSRYVEGYFAVLAPLLNRPVQRAIVRYRDHLSLRDAHVPFLCWTLEEMVEHLQNLGAAEDAQRLHERYCDWERVHREVETTFAVAGQLPRNSHGPARRLCREA